MIIIDKIKIPSPFFTRVEMPSVFKTTLDKQKYLAEEKRRWIEGYGGLNGMLYYYATQVVLKDRLKGIKYYPTVRDVEAEIIFPQLEDCFKNGESPFIVKGRGVGLSSIGMNLPHYFFRVYPNTTCIATSKNKKTLAELFTEKTMISFDEMNPAIKPDLIAKNQTANESFLRYGYKYLDERGREQYSENKFLCRDTQESDSATTNFSGAGAIFGFADEAPLMPRLNGFFDSAIECFTNHSENRLEGLLLFGGTVEDSVPVEAVQRLQEVWNNAKELKIRPIFIPSTYGKHLLNGHSDHKKAEEEILRRRDELDKLTDKTRLQNYIKNNPLSIDEIFNFAGSSRFDEYTIQRINLQINELEKPSNKFAKPTGYNLVEHQGELTAIPKKDSNFQILEHPKDGVRYMWSLDATQSTENTSGVKKNSKFSITIMKGVDPQAELQFAPVARFLERPKNFDDVFDWGIRIFKYYNKYGLCKHAGELNATGGVMLEKLQKEGFGKNAVAKRDLYKSGWVETKRAWFYRVDATIDWQYLAANTYFKKYVEMVRFVDLLKEAQMPEETNKDYLDSFLAGLWGWMTGDLLNEKVVKKAEVKVVEGVRWNDQKQTYEVYDIMTGQKVVEKFQDN